ncbi:MAG TPA: hypothetical protein EYQ74_06775 [Planctomycetes bacterium]|nr:hypothetical protein [Planctomycetota bacterium]HIK59534.1 hypothetical protein [Planctomycetota bacterium]
MTNDSVCQARSFRRGAGALLRLGLHRLSLTVHLLGVYSGVRAAVNRIRALTLQTPGLSAVLDHCTLDVPSQGRWHLRVHRRCSGPQGLSGIVSARRVRSPLASWLYRYLCLCGHFGCGHVELGFCERAGRIRVYAVRNTALSCAQRLGWKRAARRLTPRRETALFDLVHAVVDQWRGQGLRVSVPTPEECVRLSVNPLLLHPERERDHKRVLHARAERLRLRVGAG